MTELIVVHMVTIVLQSLKYFKRLKIGKSDGYDGLTSNYIINGTPLLTHYLSMLFSLILSHCYTPTSCVSTMIPIPKKGSGSMNDIRNYREIALSSLLSKLFDHCIICNQYDSLRSDDLQFAYKSKISAIDCVNSVNKTVNYYINNSGKVYVCTLDRVNLLTLFKKLFKRNMCPLFLKFLIHSYCNQKMRIKWNAAISDSFDTSHGSFKYYKE